MSQPTTNPPGGGRWTWDEAADQWVSLDTPAAPAAADPVPAEPEPAEPEPAKPAKSTKATPTPPQE